MGCATSQEVWVFGLVDTSHTPALGYMHGSCWPEGQGRCYTPPRHSSPYCSRSNHPFGWVALISTSSLPAHCCTVNHSLHFVDPSTGVHTQNVESYWGRVKRKIKHMKGCHATEILSYLDEFMWKERFGKTKRASFSNICWNIAAFYPV